MTPISGSFWNEDLDIEGYASKGHDDTLVYFNQVSDRYLETMGTDLIAGRDFRCARYAGVAQSRHCESNDGGQIVFRRAESLQPESAIGPIGRNWATGWKSSA